MPIRDVTSNGANIATETSIAAINAKTPTLGAAAASAAAPVSGASVQDANNTRLSTIAGSTTWDGTYVDTTGYAQIVTCFKSDQAGTFTFYFSSDGITADRTVGPYTLAANTDSPQPLQPVRRYYRCAFANSSGTTANVRIETRLYAIPGLLKTRLNDDPTALSPADLTRSVAFGIHQNDQTYDTIGISGEHGLNVSPIEPLTAFGELSTAHMDPRVQIDAVYGILTTDHESLIDTSPGTGSVTATGGVFVCETGTGIGGYGVLRSRRILRYRAGQGSRFRFTGAFTTGIANSLQLAGAFTATDGLFFGYSGTTFGLMRRIAGAVAIHQLTITVGAAAAENMTVTLNGVAFVVASGGALSTTATAEKLAEAGGYTGWTSAVSPTSNGATVTWLQQTPAATVGAFTFASTGAAAGTFATIQAGAANDQATGFVAQSAWNVDQLDGGNDQANPSGMTLDPTKLNVFEIVYPYLGAGTIVYRVMTPSGRWATVHRIEYPNTAIIPSQRNPAFRLGWVAASLGSNTNLTVRGASAAAFIEGEVRSVRDPFGTAINNFTATATEYVALAVRVGATFGSTVNQRELLPQTVVVGTETSNRIIRVRVILNPTLTGTVDWTYVNSARSGVEYATPTTLTPSGGSDVAYTIAASGSPSEIELHELGLQLEPGDVIAIALTTASGSATCATSINWQEV